MSGVQIFVKPFADKTFLLDAEVSDTFMLDVEASDTVARLPTDGCPQVAPAVAPTSTTAVEEGPRMYLVALSHGADVVAAVAGVLLRILRRKCDVPTVMYIWADNEHAAAVLGLLVGNPVHEDCASALLACGETRTFATSHPSDRQHDVRIRVEHAGFAPAWLVFRHGQDRPRLGASGRRTAYEHGTAPDADVTVTLSLVRQGDSPLAAVWAPRHRTDWIVLQRPRTITAMAAHTGCSASVTVIGRRACAGCGAAKVPLSICARCRVIHYCSVACQEQHTAHRAICRALAKEADVRFFRDQAFIGAVSGSAPYGVWALPQATPAAADQR